MQYEIPLLDRFGSSGEFGMRFHPIDLVWRLHRGLDIPANGGTPVPAAEAGTVIHAGENGGEGYSVWIRHADGNVTKYFHMQNGSLRVREGWTVRKGETLGLCGTTGSSTGNHVHFETHEGSTDNPVNPREFVERHSDTAPAANPIEQLRRKPKMDVILHKHDNGVDQAYYVVSDLNIELSTEVNAKNVAKLNDGKVIEIKGDQINSITAHVAANVAAARRALA